MKNKINAHNFFEVWKTVVSENEKILRDNWRKFKNFTWLIRGDEKSILSEVAKRLELNVYEADYYSIDTVFYEEEGEEMQNHFSEIIKGNRKEKEFSDNEEILVIYGYESDFEWNGYIYKSDEWIKL